VDIAFLDAGGGGLFQNSKGLAPTGFDELGCVMPILGSAIPPRCSDAGQTTRNGPAGIGLGYSAASDFWFSGRPRRPQTCSSASAS
jgi:hypothetical protein